MHIKIGIVLFLILFANINGKAQNTEIGGAFPTIDHSGRLNEKWSYNIYYFGAFSLLNQKINGIKEKPFLNAFYSEQSISYDLNKGWSLTGSYVFERQNVLREDYRNENRFYIQTTNKYKLENVSIKHRLRYDGRYIENRISNKWPYTHRLRYLFGLTLPIKKQNDKANFTIYNEFFFNLDKNATAIYGENWAFAGLNFKTKKTGNFEIGPLYIFWVANKNNDLINFYYLQITWQTNLNFSKS